MSILRVAPVIAPFEYLMNPRCVLDYGDRYIDVCDHLTHCVGVDLLYDLRIHTAQPSHNILLFDCERDLVLAMLYMSKYTAFTATAVV